MPIKEVQSDMSVSSPEQSQQTQNQQKEKVQEQKPQEQRSERDQLISVRSKLLKKTSKIEFEVDEVKYTAKQIPRSYILEMERNLIKKYDLKNEENFDINKSIYEQLETVDPDIMYEFALDVLVKVIESIDGFTLDKIFETTEFENSPTAGLRNYLDSTDTPLYKIFIEYFKSSRTDVEFVADVKNS